MITPSFGLTATERGSPRLALDWTTGSTQTGVDIVRAGVATFVGSNGLIQSATANTQRIDWTNGTPGLLVEESRTNLLTYSSDLSNAVWTKSSVNNTGTPPYVDVQTSPDGTTTADKFIPITSAAAANFARTFAVTSGLTYTFSFFAKASEQTKISMVSNIVTGFRVSVFNLSTKTVQSTGSGWTSSVTPFADNWVRCVSTFTATSTASVAFQISNNSAGWTGNGTDGVFIWGAQLEAGAFATSYIPTVASQVTRNADVATMTGANFSDWFNASQGTFRVDAATPASGTRSLISADDNTSGNSIVMSTVGTVPKLIVTQSSSEQANVSAGTITANTSMFAYSSYAPNYFGIARPSARQVDISGIVPTVNQLRIGTDQAGNYANGIIQSIRFWP